MVLVMRRWDHVVRPGKQALTDQGRLCCYNHSCPAGRICHCVSAHGTVHRMVAGNLAHCVTANKDMGIGL